MPIGKSSSPWCLRNAAKRRVTTVARSAATYRTAPWFTGRPNQGFPEECYEHDTIPDTDGSVAVAVVNRDVGLGAYQLYRKDQFAFHTMWRMLGEGTYGVAMEPTTNRDAGRFDARERGELAYLAPGEMRAYDLEIGALDGLVAINAFAARVDALAGTPAGKSHRA